MRTLRNRTGRTSTRSSMPSKIQNKPLRMVDGYYKAQPQGNGYYKIKSIDRAEPYKGTYKLEKTEGAYHYYRNVTPKKYNFDESVSKESRNVSRIRSKYKNRKFSKDEIISY